MPACTLQFQFHWIWDGCISSSMRSRGLSWKSPEEWDFEAWKAFKSWSRGAWFEWSVTCRTQTSRSYVMRCWPIDAGSFLTEFVFVQSCLARWPLKLSSTILHYVDLTLLEADWGMLSRFFWICSRPLIGFGLRRSTSYNLLHVLAERLKWISNGSNTVEWKNCMQDSVKNLRNFQVWSCLRDQTDDVS